MSVLGNSIYIEGRQHAAESKLLFLVSQFIPTMLSNAQFHTYLGSDIPCGFLILKFGCFNRGKIKLSMATHI